MKRVFAGSFQVASVFSRKEARSAAERKMGCGVFEDREVVT